MPGFSDYLEKKILDLVFGSNAYSIPATLYVGLFTVTPADDGTGGTEVTGGSYARVGLTNNSTNFPNATGGDPSTKSNGVAITYPAATANWGTVVGVGIFDALTTGNLLAWNSLIGTTYAYSALASSEIFTAPASSFGNDDTIRLLFDLGGTTPTGVSLGITYYIKSVSGITFQLAATSGGSAINITTDGSGRLGLITPKIINSGDTASFAIGTLTIVLD